MTINMRSWLLATACAMAFLPRLPAQMDNSTTAAKPADNSTKPQKNAVTKLDGTKLFGVIEITDDYTIRIKSDSGITRLPLAQLGDADFQKYGFQKDRSKDGRFWYERKEALESSKEDPESKKNANSEGKAPIEIRLSEISAFQPFIAAYEQTLAAKKSEKATTTNSSEGKSNTSDIPFRPMFSERGLGGPLPQPLSGLSGSALQPASAIQPAVPGGEQIMQSAAGSAGLPSAP